MLISTNATCCNHVALLLMLMPESAVTVNVRLLYTVQLVKLLSSVFYCLASGYLNVDLF